MILMILKKYIMVLQNPKVHIIALGGFNADWTKEEIPLFVNTIKDRGYLYTAVGVQGYFETWPPKINDLMDNVYKAIQKTPKNTRTILLGFSIDTINVIKYTKRYQHQVDGVILINPFFRFVEYHEFIENVIIHTGAAFPNVDLADPFFANIANVITHRLLPMMNINVNSYLSQNSSTLTKLDVPLDYPNTVWIRQEDVYKKDITLLEMRNAIMFKNQEIQGIITDLANLSVPLFVLCAEKDIIADPKLDDIFVNYVTVPNCDHLFNPIDTGKFPMGRKEILEEYLKNIFRFIEK